MRAPTKQDSLRQQSVGVGLARVSAKDPDELSGNGIGSVIVGDGFLMVAVFLGVTHSSVSSLLWLLLLIPAFFFFGKGFSDVFHARQIRRLAKQAALDAMPAVAELSSPRALDVFKSHVSSELPSVTERTTRHLE
ncbi:MAG: hypothetical protein ACREA9_06210 [Pyrinomonadaceae bacterium]